MCLTGEILPQKTAIVFAKHQLRACPQHCDSPCVNYVKALDQIDTSISGKFHSLSTGSSTHLYDRPKVAVHNWPRKIVRQTERERESAEKRNKNIKFARLIIPAISLFYFLYELFTKNKIKSIDLQKTKKKEKFISLCLYAS
jgi:hypothetical protein